MDGIKPVPRSQRTLTGLDFFLLWAGAAVSLAEIWAGGILLPMGYITGLVVILLGHILGNTPLALGGLIGSKWGIPTMVSTRVAFGIRGSYIPASLNIFQLIGWTAVMVWIGGQTAATFTQGSAVCTAEFWIILLGVVTTLWALVGYRFWKWLHRIAVTGLVILCLVMTYVVFKEYGIRSLLQARATGELPGSRLRYRYAHLLAPLGVRLLSVCPKGYWQLLGDMDWLFPGKLLDVLYRAECGAGHQITYSRGNGIGTDGVLWSCHSRHDHCSLLHVHHHLSRYLLNGGVRLKYLF